MKIKAQIFFILILLTGCSSGRNIFVESADSKAAEYIVDGNSVGRSEFQVFLGSLRENHSTWYCAETKDGGITGYEATGLDGTVYKVIYISGPGKTRNIIQKKEQALK